jgi:ArsR family transcriptional regulator
MLVNIDRRQLIEVESAPVRKVRPDPDGQLLQAIADPLRLRIVRQLADVGAVCACDIAAGYPVSQPTVSHHLRVLREAGWVEGVRRGTWIWYSLRPDAAARLHALADALATPAGAPPRLPRLRVIQPDA